MTTACPSTTHTPCLDSNPDLDGFAHRAQVKQAEVGLDEIRLNKAECLDDITISVKSAVFDLQIIAVACLEPAIEARLE